ncbi:MAG: aconitase X catalytic domain-containing protein [Thermoproteota archaeon]
MYLSKDEERMLVGEFGYAMQKAMEILIALGKIYDAEKLIPITSAHISGVSYANVGEDGLEFLEELASDGKVLVKTTLNPAGMDLDRWSLMGIDREFAENQLRMIDVYRKMGVEVTCTCTPYLVNNMPKLGDHVAWSESSAVVYANSVIGARTNRESGMSALAAAITGRTPLYGLHIKDNRQPTVEVRVPQPDGEFGFACLGMVIGRLVGDGIPFIKGMFHAEPDELKALGAALASVGGVPMFHIEGITPEAKEYTDRSMEKLVVTEADIMSIKKEYTSEADPDLIFLGCPHLSLIELKKIASVLIGKKVRKKLWLCCSKHVKLEADKLGITRALEAAGATIVCDTCPIVAPVRDLGISVVATNSAKGAWYSRNLNNFSVKLLSTEECLREATE